MAEDEKNLYNKGPWWREGVKLVSDISAWIVVPIVMALVLGKWLDGRFGTEPVLFLSLAGLGFLVTGYGMFKVVKNYIKEISKK